jgi:hypothetical protein
LLLDRLMAWLQQKIAPPQGK